MKTEGVAPTVKVAQFFLEHAHLAHRANALGVSSSTTMPPTETIVNVEVAVSADRTTAIVSLQVVVEPSEKALYEYDVKMVALLNLEHLQAEGANKFVALIGATYLFPFVREAVANLTSRGRFGPVWLQPFNLRNAVYGDPNMPVEGAPPAKAKRRKSKGSRQR